MSIFNILHVQAHDGLGHDDHDHDDLDRDVHDRDDLDHDVHVLQILGSLTMQSIIKAKRFINLFRKYLNFFALKSNFFMQNHFLFER